MTIDKRVTPDVVVSTLEIGTEYIDGAGIRQLISDKTLNDRGDVAVLVTVSQSPEPVEPPEEPSE